MAFHSKTHWKDPGVVIAFEPTWNLISKSSLENAELGNCRYSQIHVGEPSVCGETVYLAFLEPQLRHELSNVLDGMCCHNLWVICQVSCRPPVTRKLRNTCLSISKVFKVVLILLYIQDVQPGYNKYDARNVSDFTLPLHQSVCS